MKLLGIIILMLHYDAAFSWKSKDDSFFQTIYDTLVLAKHSARETAKSIHSGIKTLVEAVQFIEHFIDSSIEEDCIFQCEENFVPVPKPYYAASSNGCGALGLYLKEQDLPQAEMTDCCDEHDICYSMCGGNKENCDKIFKKCLYGTCKNPKSKDKAIQQKVCQAGAKILYTATIAVGCAAFKDAQKESCQCVPLFKNSSKHTEL